MMKYAGIINNDVVNGYDVCVSFWTQGCPHKCRYCHNPQTWDYDGGLDLPSNILEIVDDAITKNGIERNFSILGGEPLCDDNKTFVLELVEHVRERHSDIVILLWTGYLYEDVKDDPVISKIFDNINVLIDGPYEHDKRDITAYLMGSTNQRIFMLNKSKRLQYTQAVLTDLDLDESGDKYETVS